MPKTTTRRDEAKYRLLPPIDPETYAGLKANIALHGVIVPVVRDEDGYILDGFARTQIARELGYECPTVVQKGLSEQEKRSQVRALNLARRHMDQRARRDVIADELRENPGRSNRWIAKSLGVHHDINPARNLIRDHQGLVVSGGNLYSHGKGTSIVMGRGAIPSLV
jgi:ParB-like chromosome segregation protein Spo0J